MTDIGIGYISTMLAIHTLFLRWCTQIRDFGLQHICGMRSMQVLSLAGEHFRSYGPPEAPPMALRRSNTNNSVVRFFFWQGAH